MAPSGVTNTGKYLPSERPPGFMYPFANPGNPDNFRLERQTGPDFTNPQEADMLELLMDDERLKHIGRSKMPGPDALPNELLKALHARRVA